MATFNGNDGVIEFGANVIGEVTSFNVTQSVATIDDTVMGDTWKTHLVDVPEWSGSITSMWDDGDTAQTAMTIGASGTTNLLPEGAGVGNYQLSGTVTVTNIDLPVERGGVITQTFQFTGNGALTIGTDS